MSLDNLHGVARLSRAVKLCTCPFICLTCAGVFSYYEKSHVHVNMNPCITDKPI